jgi:hypothetical protein
MLVAISPSNFNYDETLNTLQYASRAKQILNKVSINSTSKEAIITKLKSEIDEFAQQLQKIKDFNLTVVEVKEIKSNIQQRQKLLNGLGQSWDERVKESKKIQEERKQLTLSDSKNSCPFLIDTSPDVSIDRELIHEIQFGVNTGVFFHPSLRCVFLFTKEDGVWLIPYNNSEICMNGQLMSDRQIITHGDKITSGDGCVFKFKIVKK